MLVVRGRDDHSPITAMVVLLDSSTVLHEDSTLVSGDFPAMARRTFNGMCWAWRARSFITPAPGNQSPRGSGPREPFAEAERLGELLGRSVVRAIESVSYTSDITLGSMRLRPAAAPGNLSVEEAQARLIGRPRLQSLRQCGADRGDVRTADAIGSAPKALALARAAAAGRIQPSSLR